METKVISARIKQDFFNRINTVADRLYPKSYTNQPNRTQLIIDALNLFCDLAETDFLDDINLSQTDIAQRVYSVNKTEKNAAKDEEREILESLAESVSRIEDKLNYHFVYSVNKALEQDNVTNSNIVYSVNEEDYDVKIFALKEAWLIAKDKGFESNKESFRKRFDRRSDDPDYILCGFKRIPDPKGRGYLYQMVSSQMEG